MKNETLFLPEVVRKEKVYDNYLHIEKETLKLENGSEYDYFVLKLSPTAVMNLCFTPEGKLVVNREYRHPTGHALWSLPGGFSENEKHIDTAKRELMEEAGYAAENFEVLGESFPFPGISNQKTVFVKSKEGKRISNPDLEPGEILETHTLSLTEIHQKIIDGEPMDGILLTGLQFLALK